MKGPFLWFVVLAAGGLFLLQRHARRWLRDDFRHRVNPREAKVSSLVGLALGALLLACSGAVLGTIAGLSRYVPQEAGAASAVVAALEPSREGLRLALRGLPASPEFPPALEGGWFSIAARRVSWRGPMRWAGFPDAIRPVAVLTARERSDLGDPSRIGRRALSEDSLFESILAGPAAALGLWTLAEVRTPWRPLRAGSAECLFTEQGSAVLEP